MPYSGPLKTGTGSGSACPGRQSRRQDAILVILQTWYTVLVFLSWDWIFAIMPREAIKERRGSSWVIHEMYKH